MRLKPRVFVAAIFAATLSGQEPLRLTLQDAERIAVQNNPRVSSANYLAEASKEVPKELRSAYQPMVFGSITSAGASDNSRIAAGALNNPVIYDRFASGIGVSQLITDFGRTANLVGSAQARSQAEVQNSQATRASILLAVDRAYFAALRAQALLRVARQTVAARQLVADQIGTLARNLMKSNLDVSFANVNLSEAQLLLSSAQNDVKASLANLATAIGYPNQREFMLAEERLPAVPPDDPKPLIAEAIQNRPELLGLRFEQEAAARFTKAERKLVLPTIGAIAAVGLVPAGVGALSSRYGAAGLNVNVPLFNGGLFTSRRTEAELRERSTQENLKAEQNRVIRDVQVAYLNAVTGYERLSLTGKLLDQARLALSLAQTRYDLGLSSIVELSQAQLNLTSAEIVNSSARYDYQSSWSALRFETGSLK